MNKSPVLSRRRRWLFALACLLLGYVFAEAVAAVLLYVQFGGFRTVRLTQSLAVAEHGSLGRSPDILHPYLGFVRQPFSSGEKDRQIVNDWGFPGTTSPLRKRDPSRVIVAVLGGSVAESLSASQALPVAFGNIPWFAGRGVEVVPLALQGYKQPQQLIAVAYLLALGGEFDVVINLDGFNELALSAADNAASDVFPSFPRMWHARVRSAHSWQASRTIGRTVVLEDRRRALARTFQRIPLSCSCLANFVWASWDQALLRQLNANIHTYNQMLDEEKNPASRGPEVPFLEEQELLEHCAEVWMNSSRELHDLCEARGIAYYHFLQPNQYVAGSKPFSREEAVRVINPKHPYRQSVLKGYPLLISKGVELQAQGVRFSDLTKAFSDHPETLYIDDCCHVSEEGNKILAGVMAQFIAENP